MPAKGEEGGDGRGVEVTFDSFCEEWEGHHLQGETRARARAG